MFEKIELPIPGALLIKPTIHYEYRGEIWSMYRPDLLPSWSFIEDKASYSRRNVLRGLHGDFVTYKLVSCVHGAVQIALADMRAAGAYGEVWEGTINERNRWQILVPPGVLNGHLCLTEDCVFHYKLTTAYSGPDSQVSVKWDDEDLGIDWACRTPILSPRDRAAGRFKDVIEPETQFVSG